LGGILPQKQSLAYAALAKTLPALQEARKSKELDSGFRRNDEQKKSAKQTRGVGR
jgi:hypothetical protein